ncbi:hypothetical protein [Sphingobium sp. Sx8-8]|uniref:hypothetical protein n=1 Tax=Sphingobium sp. Sx8-8 TaxID=2933617 RepID=UPI001F5692B2|nr:hypothetical protein [Sphingobium sp. Sx8-8]
MADVATFDFIFESGDDLDRQQLRQGDLLRRTQALSTALGEAHAYYAEAPDYSHFMVLTQSCDLVRRSGKECKSRYITICAVRPLALAVKREFEQQFTKPLPGCPVPVGDREKSALARQFLERVVNNTVDGIFFIPRGAAESVDDHLCAFLPLSVAMRVGHYDTCLSAKVGQVKDIFAAKIGALASNLYSRIGTPDLHEQNSRKAVEAFMDGFFKELGYRSVVWLSPFERAELEAQIAVALAESGQEQLSEQEAKSIIGTLPKEADAIAERAVTVLIERGLLENDPTVKKKAKNFLVNDRDYNRLTKR